MSRVDRFADGRLLIQEEFGPSVWPPAPPRRLDDAVPMALSSIRSRRHPPSVASSATVRPSDSRSAAGGSAWPPDLLPALPNSPSPVHTPIRSREPVRRASSAGAPSGGSGGAEDIAPHFSPRASPNTPTRAGLPLNPPLSPQTGDDRPQRRRLPSWFTTSSPPSELDSDGSPLRPGPGRSRGSRGGRGGRGS